MLPFNPYTASHLSPFRQRLFDLDLLGTPAEFIVDPPQNQLWQYHGNPAVLAEQLCRNVYWYGLNGTKPWVWSAAAGSNDAGEQLARGTITTTNCGGFNRCALWIGHQVLGLDPNRFTDDHTDANDYFITVPGTQALDRNWEGNVRSLTENFGQLRAYYFKSHSYCRFDETRLDVTTNRINFQEKRDLFWCTLEVCNRTEDIQNGRVLKVITRNHPYTLPGAPPYCVISCTSLRRLCHLLPDVATDGTGPTKSFVNTMDTRTGNGWETYLIVSLAMLPDEFRIALNIR